MTQKSDFLHLHTHTEYSLLDGLSKIKELIEKAKTFGMDSLAITDHGAMYGAIDFYLKCKKAGIKPIIGCEVYVAHRSRFDKQPKIDADQYHLVLLAKNKKGYKNLIQLVTKGYLEGHYYKPRVDTELLEKYNEGLIALTACIEGEIPSLIISNQFEKAKKKAAQLQEIFGRDNFYLELQSHEKLKKQVRANRGIVRLSEELGIPLVATNDVHYVESEDALAQEILLCVQTQETLDTPNRKLSMIDSPDFYFRSPSEMENLFLEYPQAIKNTRLIAERCNLEIETGNWHLPDFEVPEGFTPDSFLRYLCEERIKHRYPKVTEEIKKRLDYELSVITQKGYSTYFLIVQDFVNWAKKQGIRVGPGRGSSAGSVVSYILRITSVDPIFFRLPFERFMYPDRPSTPDFDLDFADDRRDEVIDYVRQKYGDDRVAHIISFGRMEARGAVRDVGRVLGMPYSEPDKIAKLIPFGSSIGEALKQVFELKEFYEEPKYKRLLSLAQKLEGVARHSSIHAAGVVIGDKPLTEYVPLQRETKRGKGYATQYDMYCLDIDANKDAVGLLKADFLGLRNLTILERAREIIEKEKGVKIDISEIPLDDRKTYQFLATGNTMGVFQLESTGMKRVMRELKPTNIFDLMALVALYRPGPMQVIPEFTQRKHNPKLIKYLDPRLKSILDRSYGVITYQDDVLLVATEIAGYTWREADKLRHAMSSKKHRPDMKKIKDEFVEKCKASGLEKKKAEVLFKLIEPFGAYGFNKAHAACYATIAYQTAYLKANFPVEFMTAVLSAEASNKDQLALMVSEAKNMGIEVFSPDINFSKENFSIENGKIRFGLSAIKNVGGAAVRGIIRERQERGPFKGLDDFCHRVNLQIANKKVLESLIKSGAMDSFGSRSAQLLGLDKVMKAGSTHQKKRKNGQMGLFDTSQEKTGFMEIKLPEIEEESQDERLSWEKSLLGLYLGEHPLERLGNLVKEEITHRCGIISEEDIGQRALLASVVSQVKRTLTRAGNHEMAFVKLEDETGSIEGIVFPKIFASTKACWREDETVAVTGRIDSKGEGDLKIIVEDARNLKKDKPLEAIRSLRKKEDPFHRTREIAINIPEGADVDLLKRVREVLSGNRGGDKAIIYLPTNGNSIKRMNLPFGIRFSAQLKEELENLIGPQRVTFTM